MDRWMDAKMDAKMDDWTLNDTSLFLWSDNRLVYYISAVVPIIHVVLLYHPNNIPFIVNCPIRFDGIFIMSAEDFRYFQYGLLHYSSTIGSWCSQIGVLKQIVLLNFVLYFHYYSSIIIIYIWLAIVDISMFKVCVMVFFIWFPCCWFIY